MGNVLAVLLSAVLILAGLIVSLVAAGWIAALLCSVGILVGLAALVGRPRTA